MKCDIVLVSWNHLEFLKPCVEHIVENTRCPYRLIIVDNASDRETTGYLDSLKKNTSTEVLLIKNHKNLGFVKAVNQGLKISNAPYVCIFNNDTLAGSGWLGELVNFAEKRPDVGLLNPISKGHGENGLTVNEYAERLLSHRGKSMEMNQCQGFCMLVKKEVMDKIGYLDERFDTVGFDDTDYSMRAHLAGYRSVCVHSSYVYHRGHASFDKMGDRKKIQSVLENRYFAKWPRHLRVAVFFSVSKDTSDEKVSNFLSSALFLAREWCWVNLMLFGDKNTKEKIETIKKKTDFPLHQNIKFNYLKRQFKLAEIAARILERSFGRKARKRYDVSLYDNPKMKLFIQVLCGMQKCNAVFMDFFNFSEEELKNAIRPFRKEGLREKDSLKCDIILPVCDQYDVTKICIESIIKNTDTPFRFIIINNGKNPETRRLLDELNRDKKVETKIVHNDENTGWVRALNKGIELSDAPFVCFQNNDTAVTRGWLGKMIDVLGLSEDFGMVNPTWEGRPPAASIDKYNRILEKRGKKFVRTDWCRGFSVVMKRAVIEKIGMVDESYGLGYLDDVDYSVRATEAGYTCLRALDTYVYHQRNVTASKILGKAWAELHERNKTICRKKWGRPLKIALILDKSVCARNELLNRMENLISHLTRKQHHVDIWSPGRLPESIFQHTNIRLKSHSPLAFRLRAFFDLHMNNRKKPEKRYDAVFNFKNIEYPEFDKSIMATVDALKEKTKEF